MLREPHPQRIADIRADPRFRWWPSAHPTMEAFLGVPIRHGDEILGAIYVANGPVPVERSSGTPGVRVER